MASIKSCGKTHSYCRACRPEVANKTREHIRQYARTHSWNRGLTKETDVRVAANGQAIHEAVKDIDCSLRYTPEVRERIAESVAKYHEQHPGYSYPRGRVTTLERGLRRLLDLAGLEYETQKRFGRYVVDAYVQSHNLVFEADGSFWHDQKRDAVRDTWLIENTEIIAVVRLTEQDLRNLGRRKGVGRYG